LLHVWPVFLNKDGKIIYVPRYKKGFSEYHSSILNIHVKNDEKVSNLVVHFAFGCILRITPTKTINL
jgi:hypothetical protein